MEYNDIAVNTIGSNRSGEVSSCDLPFNDDFRQFNNLYLFSAVLMLVGLAVVYNLDKKTMAQMTEELAARKEVVADTSKEA